MIRGRQVLHTDAHAIAVLDFGRDLRLWRDGLRGRQVSRKGTLMRHVPSQRGPQFVTVVGEELRIVGPTRDGDVSHAVVEQVLGPQLSIDVDQHPVGGLALAGMTGYGVAMIEMRMLCRIKLDRAASVHLERQPSILADALHRSQLTVRDLQLMRGRGELHPISGGKDPLLFAVDGDALLTAGVVGPFGAIFPLDGEPVAGRVRIPGKLNAIPG